MDEMYNITIDDGAPIPSEENLKDFAIKIGVTYEEYIEALDNGIYKTGDVLEYVRKMRNK